jgi:hypothetical protein
MYDGVFGGSSMGNFNICHHSSKTTACTYQANEIIQSSIPMSYYYTCGLSDRRSPLSHHLKAIIMPDSWFPNMSLWYIGGGRWYAKAASQKRSVICFENGAFQRRPTFGGDLPTFSCLGWIFTYIILLHTLNVGKWVSVRKIEQRWLKRPQARFAFDSPPT